MSFLKDTERKAPDPHTDSINIHAKTKVGHLNRQIHTQKGFIKALEQENGALEADNKRLQHRLAGQKGAFRRLKSKLRAAVATTMGVAAIIHPDFIPL